VSLRVGLNLFYWVRESGGSGTYARELIPALLEAEPGIRITAFVSRELPEEVRGAPWAGEIDWVTFPFTVTHGPPLNFAATMGSQWGALPAIALRRRLQVVHGLANITPLLAPGVATVATLLDLIWLRHPETMDRKATIGMKMTAPVSAKRADRVIAISEAAKHDIIETLGIPASRIDVTHLGINAGSEVAPADEGALRERLGLGGAPVVLCVAQKRSHKNLLGLVRAVAEVADRDARLVLPGSPTPHEDELRAEAARLGIADRVVFPAWLTREELEGLYRLSGAFVLPSFEEGFGLPLLEAMARDVPVATSNISSMPEVAGEAAEYFDPHSPREIAAAIDRILGDGGRRERLVAAGRERVAHFTWSRTAEATLDVYRRAISQ
jgi:glycosyltransferase involved in cell wall biosynthesis